MTYLYLTSNRASGIKKEQIELKGADGYIDLTEVFGRPMYGNRPLNQNLS